VLHREIIALSSEGRRKQIKTLSAQCEVEDVTRLHGLLVKIAPYVRLYVMK
jgi:hypothetical protein